MKMVYVISYIAIGMALVVFLLPRTADDKHDAELGAMFLFTMWPIAVPFVVICALGKWAYSRRFR